MVPDRGAGLEHKRRAGEAREGKPIVVIDTWVEAQLQRLATFHPTVTAPDFSVLDRLLFEVVTGADASVRQVPSSR